MNADESALTNGKPWPTPESAAAHFELRLALDGHAPGAARSLVRDCLRARVKACTLDDAQLLVSELVTNSVCYGGTTAADGVVVRVDLTPGMVRLEVEDAGSGGDFGPRTPDPETGGGFGLSFVQSLSERWGVERIAAGGTRVWAQLVRA